MKYLILLIAISPLFAGAKRPMDPTRKVYQNVIPGLFGVGGYYVEVEPLTEEQLRSSWDRLNQQKMYEDGYGYLKIGLLVLVCSFFLSGVLAQYGAQMIPHFSAPLGAGTACTGAILMKLSEWWVVCSVGLAGLIIYGIFSYVLRDKGLKIPVPFKKKVTSE